MADPTDTGAATAQESTTQEQDPAPAGNGDGDLSPDARKAVEGADKPDEVRALISAANRARRQAEGELKQARLELQQHQDAGKSESEKLAGRAERAETRVAELERELVVSRVALKHGIPEEDVGRLRGTTEEELEADAKAFAKRYLTQQQEPPPDLGSGVRTGAATATGSAGFSEAIRRRAQGRR